MSNIHREDLDTAKLRESLIETLGEFPIMCGRYDLHVSLVHFQIKVPFLYIKDAIIVCNN